MQAFYVKKEKKLPNGCHKSSKGNLTNFHEKMKENVNKNLYSSSLKIFF